MRLTATLLLAGLAIIFAAGCTTVQMWTHREPDLPAYRPTEAGVVGILRAAPDLPNVRLGEMYVQPEGNPTTAQIEAKLQETAGKMGADAVVIVWDQSHRMGMLLSGPWYNRPIPPQDERCIIAVAIRYTS
jgi:hypothetical protein